MEPCHPSHGAKKIQKARCESSQSKDETLVALPPEIEANSEKVNVALAHRLMPRALVKNKTATIKLQGTKEDLAFLKHIAKANGTTMSKLMSDIWAMHCRMLRTGRAPDGKAIDYREVPVTFLPKYICELLELSG